MTQTTTDCWEPLVEHVLEWRDAELQIETSQRLVQNVVLCGAVSRNGHRYTPAALQQAAALYQHKPVFLDHAPQPARPLERSTRDLVGMVQSARYGEDRIRGDIQVLDTEAGRTFLALIEAQQPAFGMSHVVLAQRGADGKQVERIHDVISVDAVVFPATTAGLRESWEQADGTVVILQEQLRLAEAEVERLQGLLAERDSQAEIDALLQAAELPDSVVTPLFYEQLQRAADPQSRRQLISERQQLVRQFAPVSVLSRPRVHSRDAQADEFVRAVRGDAVGVLCRAG